MLSCCSRTCLSTALAIMAPLGMCMAADLQTTLRVGAQDTDGPSPLTYTWSLSSKPAGYSSTPTYQVQTLGAGDAGFTNKVLATIPNAVAGAYIFRVAVFDGAASATSQVTVTVREKTPYDFNGDGLADIAYWNESTGQAYSYISNANGTSFADGGSFNTAPTAFKIVGVGDMNGDGRSDLVYWNETTGETHIALFNASGKLLLSSGLFLTAGAEWRVVGVADTNGDRRADIVYWNSATGETFINLTAADGLTRMSGGFFNVSPLAWKVSGVADTNGDGRADVIYRNDATGEVFVWLTAAGGLSRSSGGWINSTTLDWKIMGVADTNGDRRADIIYRNSSTGQLFVWLTGASGISQTSGGIYHTESNASRKVVQIADFNGDGRFDVVYRDDQTGLVQVLLTATNGVSASSVNTYITVSNLAWKIVPYLPSALGATAMEVVIPIGNG
jgi:hypothetical protein